MSKQKLSFILIFLLIFGGVAFFLVNAAFTNKEMNDEYVFYRLSRQLPDMQTSVDWLFVDRPDLVLGDRQLNIQLYDIPIALHPPLANYLVWPFAQLTDSIQILRLIPIILSLVTLWLTYLIVKRRLGNSLLTLLVLSPILLFKEVLAAGGTYFYYEAFMVFFLVLTIYLSDKGSKWRYLSAAAMVLSKMPGVLFLIPLVIKERNWKMLLPGIVLLPYYVATVVITGDPLYLLSHWLDMKVDTEYYFVTGVLPNIGQLILRSCLIQFGMILIPSIYFALKQTAETKQTWLVVLLGLSVLLGIGWSFVFYQMFSMIFVTLMLFSYTVEFLREYYGRRKTATV